MFFTAIVDDYCNSYGIFLSFFHHFLQFSVIFLLLYFCKVCEIISSRMPLDPEVDSIFVILVEATISATLFHPMDVVIHRYFSRECDFSCKRCFE